MQTRHRYIAVLAVIAVLILVIGFLLRPAPPTSGKKRPPDDTVSHAEIENLRELVRRNSLRNVAADFTALADQVFSQVATVRPWGSGALVMPDGSIVGAKLMDRAPQQLTVASGENSPHPLAATVWIPGLPFFSGHAEAAGDLSPSRLARALPPQGSWLLLVTDGANSPALVSPGVLSGVGEARCGPFITHQLNTTIPLTQATMGAGVFDLSGNLQGMVVQCDDGISILGIGDIQQALSHAASSGPSVLARYGMRFAPPQASNGNAAASLLIGEVWTGWPADVAGLQPGDVLLSVDGKSVTNIQDATALLLAEKPAYRLRVRRGQRLIAAEMASMQTASADSERGVETEPSGVRVLHVTPGSSAARAGLRSGDFVLRAGNLPAGAANTQALLGSYRVDAPVQTVIWRPGRQMLIWINP
jgi:S1-C subfamily serine protease